MTAAESETSQEIEYPDEVSRAHARANRHSGPWGPSEGTSGTILPTPDFEGENEPEPRLAKQPGLPTRTTEWLWQCHRGHQVVLWSKARAVQCDSGCGSRQWEVLLKQDPNESTRDWETRLAEAGRKPYEPRWDKQGRRIS